MSRRTRTARKLIGKDGVNQLRCWALACLFGAAGAAILALMAGARLARAADALTVPAWLFPNDPPGPVPATTEPDTLKTLPGSEKSYTSAQAHDLFNPPDWRPDLHPPMPDPVAHGREPDMMACAACHLPNGQGRPESASLSAQSATYLARQVADFRSGTRKSSNPRTTLRMVGVARSVTDAELSEAIRYYAGQAYRPWIRVVETDTVAPTRVENRLRLPIDGPREPIGHRIVETVSDLERNQLRDPATGFVAYVPIGSISRGKNLVSGKESRTVACRTCHGKDLRGEGDTPALAGRSPIYTARQLYDFQHGTRNGTMAAPMRAVVANLTEDDIIAIATYVGSMAPE